MKTKTQKPIDHTLDDIWNEFKRDITRKLMDDLESEIVRQTEIGKELRGHNAKI